MVEGGNNLVSVYGYYMHSIGVGSEIPGVWVTLEYRSNVDIWHSNTQEIIMPANTGNAKKVTLYLDIISLRSLVPSSDAWLEIRTLDINGKSLNLESAPFGGGRFVATQGAYKHGEIKRGEVTRRTHTGGTIIKTVIPISTEDKNPIIVRPKK